jgi:hypothetical protein
MGMASWNLGLPEVYAPVVQPPALQPHVDASETPVRLSHAFEWNEDMDPPAVGGKSPKEGSMGAWIGVRRENPVETLVADDHRRPVIGPLVEREAIPCDGPRRKADGSVPIETCVDDRFGLQHSRFVREHLTSSSYTSVVHGLATRRVIRFLLRTRGQRVDDVSMKDCTHLYREQQIGAGLVRRICVHCSSISIGERSRLGADPWGKRTEEILSSSRAQRNEKVLAG